MVPDWVGLIKVNVGPRGGTYLESIKKARTNPNVEIKMVAHLLWRNEAISLLSNKIPEKFLVS